MIASTLSILTSFVASSTAGAVAVWSSRASTMSTEILLLSPIARQRLVDRVDGELRRGVDRRSDGRERARERQDRAEPELERRASPSWKTSAASSPLRPRRRGRSTSSGTANARSRLRPRISSP